LALKQDNLLKEWMSREKAAVDYARTCDKRIAQLVAEADELKRTGDKQIAQLVAEADELKRTCDKRIAQLVAEADELKGQLRAQRAEQARKPALERQLEATTALVKSMTVEIDRLQAQLVKARALYKTPPKPSNASLPRLTKLQAVVDIAKAGLAEELRIMRKPEPALQETILISEGEDLIPPRWLPLKTALQSLQGISPEGKKPRH
jgi:chromosome segregation ATPase